MRSEEMINIDYNPRQYEGKTLDNWLYLDKYLGRGKAGTVFKGKVKQTLRELNKFKEGDEIAVKIYHSNILLLENQAQRLRRELELGQKVRHKNVVHIYEIRNFNRDNLDDFNAEAIIGGNKPRPYLLMEYVEGQTLYDWVKERKKIGKLPTVSEIYNISIQIFNGLKEIHNFGVHRDIKPQNIMINSIGKVKIMDYGVVKPLKGLTITSTGEFLGTIRYSSPEYLRGDNYDSRTDVYSAGTVLYLLIYGKDVFSHIKGIERFSNQVTAVFSESPFSSRELASSPRGKRSVDLVILQNLTERLLDRDPSKRPSSEQVLEALENRTKSDFWKDKEREIIVKSLVSSMQLTPLAMSLDSYLVCHGDYYLKHGLVGIGSDIEDKIIQRILEHLRHNKKQYVSIVCNSRDVIEIWTSIIQYDHELKSLLEHGLCPPPWLLGSP